MAGPAEQKIFRNFSGGVNTAMAPDALPQHVSPWGRNAVLVHVSGQVAVPERRKGFRVLNQLPLLTAPKILKLVGFNWIDPSNGTVTPYLVSVSGAQPGTSRVDFLDPADGSATNISTTAFTERMRIPDATIAQNAIFFANGTAADRLKLVKVDAAFQLQPWGLTKPAAPVVTTPSAGVMSGEYEISLSTRNEHSGGLSSRGPSVTVTVATQTLTVAWATLGLESQVTHVKVHLRKTGLNAQWFEAADVAVADGVTTVDLDDAALNRLIILSPSETEYDRPPAAIHGSAWHLSRMFVFDDTNIYWSALGAPEQFNPEASQPVNPKDGGKIVTIAQVHDSLLMILKTNAIWGLYGTSPEDWELRVINPGIGCRAQWSVQVQDGKVAWWGEDGPVLWDQSGPPIPIGRDLLGEMTGSTRIDPAKLDQLTSCLDVTSHRVLWSVTETGQSENSVIFPFNMRWSVWESHRWDPFEVSALGTALDASGVTRVYAGNPYGRVFEYGSANLDGARSQGMDALLFDEDHVYLVDEDGVSLYDESAVGIMAVFTVTGHPTSSTLTSLTALHANFDNVDAGLLGLFVYVIAATTNVVQRRRIVSNTHEVLTITPNWDRLPVPADTFYIGCPVFEWDTRWEDWDRPFDKKRFTRLLAQVQTAAPANASFSLDVMTRLDDQTVRKTVTMQAQGSTGYWDLSQWDVARFETETVEEVRAWIGRTGRSLRIRVRHIEPMIPMTLLKIGVEGLIESGRR